MVSTNNVQIIYSENIYKSSQQKPFHIMFLIKNSPLPNNYFIKLTKAASGGVLQKKMFVKISQCSQENACVEVSFKNVAGRKAIIKNGFNAGVFL